MSHKLPISLTFYTTTLGHFGYTGCYKYTIQQLIDEGCFDSFGDKVAHIKDSGEGATDIDNWLQNSGFKTKIREGAWDNHGSIANDIQYPVVGYYGDMLNLMSEQDVHNHEFIFFLEDDNIINAKKDIIYYLSKGIDFLRKNKDMLCVRVNRTDVKGWDDLSKATKVSDDIYLQNKDYTDFGPTLTFQPTLMRTRDWWTAVRFINRDWGNIKNQHCELLSGFYMQGLFSESSTPFAFFNPNSISCEHIGTKEFCEQKK